ncbi:hypothetical protein FXO38_29969 [Capsicum annuum]|nr:hypothetical protein FXO38_29969 [Capsicum annuum]KAF3639379.1 hypothetical protein FXO37_23988 [Capsicum annuum]
MKCIFQRKWDEIQEKVDKIEKMNKEKEIKLLFKQLVEEKNITEFDSGNTKGLLKLFATTLGKIKERKEQFNLQHQPSQPHNSPSNFKLLDENVSQSPCPMEDLINDQWFLSPCLLTKTVLA